MIELRTAVASAKPLVALLETEEKHGAVTQDQMCDQLMEAESSFGDWGFDLARRGHIDDANVDC